MSKSSIQNAVGMVWKCSSVNEVLKEAKVTVKKEKQRGIMKLCVFLLLLSLFCECLDANLGIKMKLTQKGLHYGMQVGLRLLKERLQGNTFEDISGEDTSGITGLDYTISKIRINNVEFPNASVSAIPGTGIQLLVNEASVDCSADWRVRSWVSSRNSGNMTVSISGVSITVVVSPLRDEEGRLMLSLESCHGKVNDVAIELDETAGYVHRIFANFLKRPLRNTLSSSLCPNIGFGIQQINEQMRQHQVRTQIDAFAVVDYSLVNAPAIFTTSINLDLKGTVYPVKMDVEPAFKPAPFTLPGTTDFMLYIGVSEYFFQSASLAYFTSGAFNVSTAEVADRYAKPLPVMMNPIATATPVISLKNGSFKLEFAGSIEVLAVLPNSTTQSMFTLNVTAGTNASVTIFEEKLMAALCLDSFQLSLAHSSVGLFKVSLLENFISYVLQNGIIPAANAKLKEGFSLPLSDMILVKPVVTVFQGYLQISTDVAYKPSDNWRDLWRQLETLSNSEEFFVI
ncbi:BPI fold-containing family C protein [Elgaria multicarinata webbii]|uniref:BPI fold-containing family C protein n=1 Tax=Elgaria multicarinata webbii TaxID=159646 RepID=UPI002FCCEFE9